MSDGRREQVTLHDGVRILAAVEIGLFGLLWMSFGVGVFLFICSAEAEHDRRMAMIRAGEVEPLTLRVLAVHRDESRGDWLVELGTVEQGVVARRETTSIEDLAVGTPVEAYPYPDEYFIPRFYNDARWGKYVFLALGLLPLPVILFVVLKRASRAEPSAA